MTEKHVLKWQVSRAKTKSDNEAFAATSVTLGMETSSNIKNKSSYVFVFKKYIFRCFRLKKYCFYRLFPY